MNRLGSPLGEAIACLRDDGCLFPQDAELLLTYLLEGRSPDFWSETAAVQIRNNAKQRGSISEFQNRAYVAKQVEAMCPSEFPGRRRAAERWLVASLDRFERAVRSSYADRRITLLDRRVAYLRSVFVLFVVSANMSSGPFAQRPSASFPPTSGRSKW